MSETERPDNHVSVFPYPGGKGRKAEFIIDRMPAHRCYVEVFGGSGAILYNKPPSTVEVYNDVSDDLVQFFEVLRKRDDDLLEWLRDVPYSRSLYRDWVSEFFDGYRPDDEIERAGRFYALRYMQFAGDISMPNGFKTRAKRSPARTFDNGRERLDELADRFRQVIIEHQDYGEILARYDDTETDVLFYCDPPYVGGEHYYGVEFDHDAFVDALRDVQSDWMVSYSELPDGLEDFHVVGRERRHRMCRGTSDATEHLVCNFDPAERALFVDAETAQTTLMADGGRKVEADAEPEVSDTERDDPLRVLFDDDHNDPEGVVLEGGERMKTSEFRDALQNLADASRSIAVLADDVEALRETGLREEDVVNLLWGRTPLNKSEIRAILEGLDDVDGALDDTNGRRHLLTRLVADVSGENLQTTRDVFGELDDLRERYGGESDR